jgi:hypothetical protein
MGSSASAATSVRSAARAAGRLVWKLKQWMTVGLALLVLPSWLLALLLMVVALLLALALPLLVLVSSLLALLPLVAATAACGAAGAGGLPQASLPAAASVPSDSAATPIAALPCDKTCGVNVVAAKQRAGHSVRVAGACAHQQTPAQQHMAAATSSAGAAGDTRGACRAAELHASASRGVGTCDCSSPAAWATGVSGFQCFRKWGVGCAVHMAGSKNRHIPVPGASHAPKSTLSMTMKASTGPLVGCRSHPTAQ